MLDGLRPVKVVVMVVVGGNWTAIGGLVSTSLARLPILRVQKCKLAL
jgi:hypothetical protein